MYDPVPSHLNAQPNTPLVAASTGDASERDSDDPTVFGAVDPEDLVEDFVQSLQEILVNPPASLSQNLLQSVQGKEQILINILRSMDAPMLDPINSRWDTLLPLGVL